MHIFSDVMAHIGAYIDRHFLLYILSWFLVFVIGKRKCLLFLFKVAMPVIFSKTMDITYNNLFVVLLKSTNNKSITFLYELAASNWKELRQVRLFEAAKCPDQV